MVSMQSHVVGQEQEPPLEAMMLSETEAVIQQQNQYREDCSLDESPSVLVGSENTTGL